MSKRKKSANGAGSVEWRGGVAWVQVSLPRAPGEKLRRPRVQITGSEKMSEAQARKEGAKLARDVRDGKIVLADGPTPKPSPTGPANDWRTVRELAKAWTGDLTPTKHAASPMLARFGKVNKLRTKAGAYIDKVTLAAHVLEVKTRGPAGAAFGDLDVSSVTSDDISAVMGAQPTEHRGETRIKMYNRLHRLFELAEFPCRLRPEGSNPVKKYLRPSADAEKLFMYLYPSEVLALLACERIPIARRVLYALATFTGQRKGSLFAMQWKHVDFDHGTLASFKTKTGRAQYFVGDPGLMTLLEAWHVHKGEPDNDQPIIVEADIGCEAKRIATTLRDEDLKLAKITRSILLEEDAENVQALRFHDLRATFCTWARRAGKSDAWISERTGQEVTGDMINRYDRGAQTLEDLGYAPFPDVSRVIPELPDARLHKRLHKAAKKAARAAAESTMVPSTSSVGAAGIEPVTPTVSR